jgi:YgiT-type zinc finger domain-containing protein
LRILYLGKTIDMKTSTLTRCPSCGSRSIRRVRKPFRARVGARAVTIPDLEREICPDCKEEFFDREANVAIDAHCFGKSRKRA